MSGHGETYRAERTRSLDVGSFLNKGQFPKLANGHLSHSSAETSGFRVGNLVLPHGDSYSGALLGNMPEGTGKYVWADGCIYEGEWRRGTRHGTGKVQWRSGAFYEGEFSGGYMHGTGTHVGPDKITYKGRWRLNLKHGLGCQTYPNGDAFEGSWIQGTIEGLGKYVWANGNVYVGNMKGGKMSGKGTLTWTNGDSFEGSWLDGMMHGFGVYTWYDGSSYVGTWTRGLKDGKGAFYPNGSRLPAVQELYLSALRKRGLLPDLRKQTHTSRIRHASSVDLGNVKVVENQGSLRSPSENLPKGTLLNLDQSRSQNVSLERRWSLEVAIEKVIRRDLSFNLGESILEGDEKNGDKNAPILEREYMQGVLISELVLNNSFQSTKRARRRQKKFVKEIKRPGEAIIKGHRSYDLMLSLQLGIRYTVGKITPIQRREVRSSDFGPRASFWMNFPKDGSQLTPSHQSEDFKWKDYCPMVFRNLREMFRIDAADYMISICGNDTLRELSSPGKSGSVFFMSQDERFMIKTLRKSEVKVLLRMLPDYHHHVRTYDNTLITKFFGLHRIKPSSGQKFRFVVMGNMFCTELRIHRRFDLKASSLGRSADKVEIDEDTILKDLDLNYFYLEPSWREALFAAGALQTLRVPRRTNNSISNRTTRSKSKTWNDACEAAVHRYWALVIGRPKEKEGVIRAPLSKGMFVPAIKGQGTDEQQQKWLPLAYKMQIIGCYAQTKLGHGSNVQGLETTATFYPQTDEFVINSPTLTSSKWWPGGLGKVSTHAVVYARLITDNKDHGVNGFIVQLRSLDDHSPHPGITVGDIGMKFGNGAYNTMDNGVLRFDNVRIPRDQMLMRLKLSSQMYISIVVNEGRPCNCKVNMFTDAMFSIPLLGEWMTPNTNATSANRQRLSM